MATAIIIAGGSGHRMGQDIPKQFINVYDKPVLIYTLEGFQKHPQIDAIEVVCIDGWHDVLKAYAKQFNISKLKWVVSGGKTGQESIRNGVYNLEGKASDEDIIIMEYGQYFTKNSEIEEPNFFSSYDSSSNSYRGIKRHENNNIKNHNNQKLIFISLNSNKYFLSVSKGLESPKNLI